MYQSLTLRYGYTPALELGTFNGPAGEVTNHVLTFDGADPSTLFYVKVFSVKGPDTAFSALRPVITASNSSGDIKVYFTNTVDNSFSTGTNAIYVSDAVDDTLINYFNRAKESIDIGIYNFGAVGVSDIAGALNAAYSRGVQIRLVVNGLTANQRLENLDPNIKKIASPTAGEDPGIMHNKFVVFDAYSFNPNDPLAWTGSTNWTNENVNTASAWGWRSARVWWRRMAAVFGCRIKQSRAPSFQSPCRSARPRREGGPCHGSALEDQI